MMHGELIDAIIQAASDAGHRLFKNHSGVAKHTKMVDGKKKTWTVRYGVGPSDGGGHDLIGWTRDGRFASIDAKVGRDKLSDEQKKWMRWVILGGGVSGEARSVEQALAILEG